MYLLKVPFEMELVWSILVSTDSTIAVCEINIRVSVSGETSD